MSYSFGKNLRITVFGQSHSDSIGLVIDGLDAGIKINYELIDRQLERRKPGKNKLTTKRKEDDEYKFISGIVDDYTCGSSICAVIKNKDYIKKDYENLRRNPRPSHADYPAFVKYHGFNDISGGGQFSGRLTAPITIAGAIAQDILSKKGIKIVTRLESINIIEDCKIDYDNLEFSDLENLYLKDFPVLDQTKKRQMSDLIEEVRKKEDSVGAVVECFAFGLPVGIGEPLYDSVESKISSAIFSIPGVRGIEFGIGFTATKMLGSDHNDEYYIDEEGKIKTRTNNHGGVIGGLTTSMPIIFRTAFKPTSSISKTQKTVDLKNKENTELKIIGRHDPCIGIRAVPVVEAMAAISLLDLMMTGWDLR